MGGLAFGGKQFRRGRGMPDRLLSRSHCDAVVRLGPCNKPMLESKREIERHVHTRWQGSANLLVPYYRLPSSSKGVPCHASPNRCAYGYPKYPRPPTMMDETKPAQLANRNRGSAAPGWVVAGSGCRCSTRSFVSKLPSERNPRRCSSRSLFAHPMGCLASPDSWLPWAGMGGVDHEPCHLRHEPLND